MTLPIRSELGNVSSARVQVVALIDFKALAKSYCSFTMVLLVMPLISQITLCPLVTEPLSLLLQLITRFVQMSDYLSAKLLQQ